MERKSGVLMHISSLWGERSSGSFGSAAKEFIDFLSGCGFSYWQVLPFTVVDECNSPYKSYSVFGGNPYFVDLDELFREGVISESVLLKAKQNTPYYCEFDRLSDERVKLLINAARDLSPELTEKVNKFIAENIRIKEFCEFMALKDANGNREWTEWQTVKFSDEVFFGWCFIQYEFFTQWAAIKKYANDKNIKIIGDMPIYVSFDSADVYFGKNNFLIDENNRLTEVAGVPPDYFSEDGQLWGNPLYNWDEMKKDDFIWWRERLSFSLELFDGVRIDHFRGFESFWAVPGEAKTAKEGKWLKGPGIELVNALKQVAGKKLIIAEDLGDITADVVKLVEDSGFPGMRVFQFGFLSDGDTPHRPHNYINNSIAYSGTHDNNTLLGYLWETPEEMKRKVMKYCACDFDKWNSEGCYSIIRTIMASAAGLAIFPIQDILGYGSDTRLNVPGRADGNWLFRITREQVASINKNKFRELNMLYNR